MLNNRTDIINFFIKRYRYKTYLEIGVCDVRYNFNKIKVAHKTGVDPNVRNVKFTMTSDDFFLQNESMFDLIFIDGLHESAQVYIDIINSTMFLNDGGTIIVHDCNPTNKTIQLVPQIQEGEWTGDCWKGFVKFRKETEDYYAFVINADYGVGVIRKAGKKIQPLVVEGPLSYENLDKNRTKWLNLIEIKDIDDWL